MYQDAIRYYREAIQVDSSFAQAYNNLGIVYYKIGSFEQALEAYNNCIRIDTEFIEAYYNRNNVQYELGNYQQALDDLKHIEKNYNYPGSIYFSKGLAFFGLRAFDSAAVEFDKASQFDPDNVEIYINLATSKFYINDFAAAEEIVQKALTLQERTSDAYNLLGMINVEKGELKKAIGSYNRGLEIESNNAYILNNRGYVYLKLAELGSALQDINESIVIDPDNPWAYRNKGIYYFQINDIENAERLLQQSLNMDKKLPLANWYLGIIYLGKGLKNNACKEFLNSKILGEVEGEKAYQQYCQ